MDISGYTLPSGVFASANTSTGEEIVIPECTASVYVLLAIPASERDLAFIDISGWLGGNQIGGFSKLSATTEIGGVPHSVWRSNRRLIGSAICGSTLTIR